MHYRQLLEIIEEGENIQCEFKRKFSTAEKIAREMVAFANTKGGYILFGVDDDKKIVGVESEKETTELVKDTAVNHCEPKLLYSIDYKEVDGIIMAYSMEVKAGGQTIYAANFDTYELNAKIDPSIFAFPK